MGIAILRRPWQGIIKAPFGTRLDRGSSLLVDLLGWWRFMEGGGTIAFDTIENNLQGIMINFTDAERKNLSEFGLAPIFDGSDTEVQLGTSNPLTTIANGLTIAAWIKPDFGQPGSGGRIVSHSNGSSGDNYAVLLRNTREIQSRISGTSRNTGHILTAATWAHVVLTYNRVERLVYVDGVLVDTLAETQAIDTGNEVSIGANPTSTNRNFSGPIADVKIYGRAITPGEVTKLSLNMNAGLIARRYLSFAVPAVTGAALAGDLSYSLVHAGTVQIGQFLSGDLNYSLNHVGDIQVGKLLAGALAYSLTHSGDIEIGKFLAGDLSYSLAHTGDISIGKFLAGNLSYSLTEVGDIQVGKLLAGALTYSLTEAGTIQVGKFLSGALSYSLTHAGTLTVGGIELAGDLVYSLTHGGTIQIGKFLAGALAYSLTHTGDLEIGKFLAGALVYSLTHQGTLAVGALLAGDLDYSLTELGDIQVGQFLSGALNYSLTEAGTIEIGKFLQGALSYSLTEAGTLTLDILLSGALNYSLAHTGDLQIGQFLNGDLIYSLTETGDIQIGINLVGQETITLTLAGTLTVAAVVFRVLIRINEALQTPNMINEELSVTERVGETLIS